MSPRAGTLAQAALAGLAVSRLARGRHRRGALVVPTPAASDPTVGSEATGGAAGRAAPRISVVIPARDEAARIAGVLEPLRGAPGVLEVIVVDDRSSDDTAAIAAALGARVISGTELHENWVGKPWALQQGLAEALGEIVVFLDADVRPDPALPVAVAALLEPSLVPGALNARGVQVPGADLASAQLAFTCPDPAQRWLHPALLATLVFRTGPLDTLAPQRPKLAAINGQCFAVRREALIAAGGFALVGSVSTDDVALARALAGAGWRIAVADGSALGSVRMYESAEEMVREWAGRSLALPGAASRSRQYVDLAVVWAMQGLPGLRLWRALLRAVARGSLREGLAVLGPLDLGLLAIRFALQVALLRVYRRGAGPDRLSALAPLADPIAAAALTRGTIAPVRRWRGRDL